MTQKFSSIGDVIAVLRAEKGLSQRDIENMSNGDVSRGWLASLESGRIRNSSPEKLEKIAAILGVSLNYIYTQAGIISTDENTKIPTAEQAELTRIFSTLSDSSKKIALALIRSLQNQQEVSEDERRERGGRS